MDKKNLMPQPAQPIHRITTGQLPSELAELSEEALQLQGNDAFGASVLHLSNNQNQNFDPNDPNHNMQMPYNTIGNDHACSYDGHDWE